jgi:prevent-host-death family protein
MTNMDGDPTESWSVAEAKAKLSEVIDQARSGRPQHITRHGRDAVVVISAEQWAALGAAARMNARKGSLLEFFEPLRCSDLQLDRPHGASRRMLDFNDPEWDEA